MKKMLYPIGEQDFRSLREGGYVYVDKTMFIQKLVDSGTKYCFLARPRRFGKSLFLSTLKYFFEGQRELFKGLYIDTVNHDWESRPVLYLDLNSDRYAEPGKLDGVLDRLLREWEEKYAVEVKDSDFAQRFATVIARAHEMTGRQVVILVDEYDKPLVGNLNKDRNFEHYRSRLASLYSNFKSGADHIRLVFLTGVSRFSKLSVFSDLNNLEDITFLDAYSDICGITERELTDNFHHGIRAFADANGLNDEEAVATLKDNYDGYRFAWRGSDIYNPWSVLNCLKQSVVAYYWNETGLPTIIAESLKRVNADLEKTLDTFCSDKDLKGFDLLNPNPAALLYQTGYLTIKQYIPRLKRYRLGIPNKEVRAGLLDTLLPYYVKTGRTTPNQVVSDIAMYFMSGEPDMAMQEVQTYFAGIPYDLKMDNENNFHNAFYILLDLIGLEAKAEAHTSDGRIDLLIETEDFIYIIELKYDRSAEEALRQIEEKHYDLKFRTDGRRIFRIGVRFSSTTRRIEDWLIKR
ncbi:MAG: ATP-binding protein [Muribaculaceae bacterium]|nr:ATP-binding protein [Muribaculaceae bacterium]